MQILTSWYFWLGIAILGCLIIAAVMVYASKLPKDRPGKHWVPTAAEVIGEGRDQHPNVRFTPPGRDGTSELECALRSHDKRGDRLLVLLDPLNPVVPYQMNRWNLISKIMLTVALSGCVIFGIGVAGFVITILTT